MKQDQICSRCYLGKDTDGDGNCPVCSKLSFIKSSKLIDLIRAQLGPHILKGMYKERRPANAKPSWGCCYVASEALYHLWGKENGYTPMCVPYIIEAHAFGTHWFLEHRPSGLQVDITADQFDPKVTRTVPDYKAARPKGFLTKQPSKRAQRVIQAVLSAI